MCTDIKVTSEMQLSCIWIFRTDFGKTHCFRLAENLKEEMYKANEINQNWTRQSASSFTLCDVTEPAFQFNSVLLAVHTFDTTQLNKNFSWAQ